jgi:hypothetical protein
MHATRSVLSVLTLILGLAAVPAQAGDWKPVAKDRGVELAYQAVGNIARLRFTNSSQKAVTVNWDLRVKLANGNTVDNKGNLQIGGGETETVVGGPFRDASGPQEVRGITGVIHTRQ